MRQTDDLNDNQWLCTDLQCILAPEISWSMEGLTFGGNDSAKKTEIEASSV